MTRHTLRIGHRRIESRDAVSLYLDVPSHLRDAFAHRPGQFVNLAVLIGDDTHVRSYSISSLSGTDAWLRITVKRVAGGIVSNWLIDHAGVGTLLQVAEPRGRFYTVLDAGCHAVLLGAGGGVAPLVPMARHLAAAGLHRVTLACGQRTREDVMMSDDIDGLAAVCDVHLRLSRPDEQWKGQRGRIDARWIEQMLPAWQSTGLPCVFYVCGPQGFMADIERALRQQGVNQNSIAKESFHSSGAGVAGAADLIVHGEIDGVPGICLDLVANVNGRAYECVPRPEDASLLAALLRSGADVPHSCMEGSCASCMARVLRGSVTLDSGTLQVLRSKDLDEGVILACLAKPRTTRVELTFDGV